MKDKKDFLIEEELIDCAFSLDFARNNVTLE